MEEVRRAFGVAADSLQLQPCLSGVLLGWPRGGMIDGRVICFGPRRVARARGGVGDVVP